MLEAVFKYPLSFIFTVCLLLSLAAGTFFGSAYLSISEISFFIISIVCTFIPQTTFQRFSAFLLSLFCCSIYLVFELSPLYLLISELVVLGYCCYLQHFKEQAILFCIVASSFCCHLVYIQTIPVNLYQHDLNGILLYMNKISQNGFNWKNFNPWSMYYLFHQPLHFLIQAYFYDFSISLWNSVSLAQETLQYLSLLFVTVTTIVVASILKELKIPSALYYFALLLFVFNPTLFLFSGYISDLLEGINLLTTYHWSVEMYYRIIIPLVMRDYEKVLYTDADIIFNEDISGIFNISFDDKELLAVSDLFNLVSHLESRKLRKQYIEEVLELGQSYTYFNSGVLMFNISAIETERYIEKMKKAFDKLEIMSKAKIMFYPDQDILNFIFNGKVKLIAQEWNLQYHLPVVNKNLLPDLNKDKLEEYLSGFQSPKIIHYTSHIKPWNEPENDLAEVFWKYARTTVFYEEIIAAMQKKISQDAVHMTSLYIKLNDNKKVILWGASSYLEDFLKKYSINKKYYPNIIGIIDKDSKRTGSFLGDYEIFLPEILKHCEADEIILTIVNSIDERYEEVKNYLKDQNINIKLSKL